MTTNTPFDVGAAAPAAVAVFGGHGGGALTAFTLGRLEQIGGARCLGFLNDAEPVGARISGHPVLGSFASWRELPPDTQFVAPLHKAKEMPARAAIIRRLEIPRARWANVIDPQAVVAPDATHGIGLTAWAGSSIMCGARVGDHVAIRSGGHVAHDCTVGDFAFIGVNAVLCGYAILEEGAYIAPGAVIRERTKIGRYSVVGLGAVVIDDVPDGAIVAGNPARVIASVAESATRRGALRRKS